MVHECLISSTPPPPLHTQIFIHVILGVVLPYPMSTIYGPQYKPIFDDDAAIRAIGAASSWAEAKYKVDIKYDDAQPTI